MATSQDDASSTRPAGKPANDSKGWEAGDRVNRLPIATYRLQLGGDFGLDEVRELLPYLKRLGISDVYLSPLFRAREESSHGYDVVDHGTIEPSFGGLPAFQRLAEAVREAGMGLLLDVVPNHMGINDPGNAWWTDVLANGEASPFAEFFDIEWQPAGTSVHHQVLLPFLGAPFGQVLERGELKVAYIDQRFQVVYWTQRFPLSIPTVTLLLDLVTEHLRGAVEESGISKSATEAANELQEIVSQLRHLTPLSPGKPTENEIGREKQREALRRLSALVDQSVQARQSLDSALARINGAPGDSRSFDQLEQILDQQWYRLAYWRVAADEINYRRFFDINDLAAIRVENPRVFEAVHRLVALCLEERWVSGLRIDHPDGLLDPQAYFEDLQRLYRSVAPSSDHNAGRQIYILAEKILAPDEPLPTDWAVCGTTGYDLLNILSRVLVSERGLVQIRELYRHSTGQNQKPSDVLYESKRAILMHSMASELQMLSAQLYRIAQQHRSSRDLTRPMLQRALRDAIASLDVYRTYVRPTGWEVSDADYRRITTAVRLAKSRNRTIDFSVFDFIASVLLLENPPSLTPEQAADRRRFALKFQQVSGPVAAKGVEDTAFYRYFPLAALNEVGGELGAEPLSVEEFHRLMRHRAKEWPHTMSATATHDTKRGEDLRARLLALSEVPDAWRDAIGRWRKMNRALIQVVDGDPAPDANEEYLLYQTLVGTWRLDEMSGADHSSYTQRIVQYMEKVLREAKRKSSWMNPVVEYEEAVFEFVRALFGDESSAFRDDMNEFVEKIATAGYVNALSQLVLKMTLPGVPDFYQGTELWDFNLVDPDNRRPVDFGRRRALLDELLAVTGDDLIEYALRLLEDWPDPRIKVFTISRCLRLRKRWPDVFAFGDYIPLTAAGQYAEHVIAFARHVDGRCVITVAPRQIYRQLDGAPAPGSGSGPKIDWKDTIVLLPPEAPSASAWRSEFSQRRIAVNHKRGQRALWLAELTREWPVAVLSSVDS